MNDLSANRDPIKGAFPTPITLPVSVHLSIALQMVWEGTDHLRESTSLFTGVTSNHYSHPGGFCYDRKCGDEPIMDDVALEDYNVDERVSRTM